VLRDRERDCVAHTFIACLIALLLLLFCLMCGLQCRPQVLFVRLAKTLLVWAVNGLNVCSTGKLCLAFLLNNYGLLFVVWADFGARRDCKQT
jgi:hypothetical protein